MKNVLSKLDRARNKRILVIGDLMVDSFTYGSVSRISPEAPVPVVEVVSEKTEAGGAGNVASNIVSLGASCRIVSVVGDDAAGGTLKELLADKKIDVGGILSDPSRPTTLKTRIIAGHQQIVRVDKEKKGRIQPNIIDSAVSYVESVIDETDAIIISDYGKGLITHDLLRKVIKLAKKRGCVITVDPKIEHFRRYRGVTCITPNTLEAVTGMRVHEIRNEEEMIDLGFKILRLLRTESVLVTRGEKGMTLFLRNGRHYSIPTVAREVYDVTGAGDTVISVFTLALTVGFSFLDAAKISNYAAGIVVGKLGTTPVTADELIFELRALRSL